MQLRYLYLFLALAGIVWPWYYNLQFFADYGGWSTAGFIDWATANAAARSIAADIGVVGVAFTIFMVAEARRLNIRYWWVLLPLTFLVALAFTFPLFLYLRERQLATTA